MKTIFLFATLLAVAASYPYVKTWTISQLPDAIEENRDPTLTPYLEEAENQIKLALFTGTSKLSKPVIPSPSGAPKWTSAELKNAIDDYNLDNDRRIAAVQAYYLLKKRNAEGDLRDSIEVAIPAMDVSIWSASDLNEALKNPYTNQELIPYLEKARAELKKAQEDGNIKETVGVVTPVGLLPHKVDYEYIPKASKYIIKKTKKGL